MRCQRCKFENIPGQKTCIKCGSILESDGTVINVYPPRMPGWQKPFRDMSRWVRRQGTHAGMAKEVVIPGWVRIILQDGFLGLLASIVPGLAHFIMGRFKEIRWYFIAWAGLLLAGFFLYGGTIGSVLIAAAIGVHVWIGLQYGFIKQLTQFGTKIFTALMVLIVLSLIYWVVPGLVFPNLASGHISFDIPYRNIKQGDYFLVHRHMSEGSVIPRGSLILIHPARLGYRLTRSPQTIIGQVVGNAGEKVEISKGAFVINGQKLDPAKYPVPEWLRDSTISINIGSKCYFVSAAYNVYAHGRGLANADIVSVCIVNAADIEGKAFILWLPLARRGFLRQVD
jgi:hypothetical protein